MCLHGAVRSQFMRGGCFFYEKSEHAHGAGAAASIVVNYDDEELFTMSGRAGAADVHTRAAEASADEKLPVALFMRQSDFNQLWERTEEAVEVRARAYAVVLAGALDGDCLVVRTGRRSWWRAARAG